MTRPGAALCATLLIFLSACENRQALSAPERPPSPVNVVAAVSRNVPVYLDDIGVDGSNPWTGELLAASEFNAENALRKIAPFALLRSRRIFKNTQWIDRMYAAHIHDHPFRSPNHMRNSKRVIANEYLG